MLQPSSDNTAAAVCQHQRNVTGTMISGNCRHGSLDFTPCFEDTAILYVVCVVFWVLAGFSFLCGGEVLQHASSSLRCGTLHVMKVVCVFYLSLHTVK